MKEVLRGEGKKDDRNHDEQGVEPHEGSPVGGSIRGSYYYRLKRARGDRGKLREPSMPAAVEEVALRKPVYGSRALAAVLSKGPGKPVNRKLVPHAFRVVGWTLLRMTKKQLTGPTHEKPKPTGID